MTFLPELHEPLVRFFRGEGAPLVELFDVALVRKIDDAVARGIEALVGIYDAAKIAAPTDVRGAVERALPSLQAAVKRVAFDRSQ